MADGLTRLRARLGRQADALAAPARAARDTATALATTVVEDPDLRDCDYGAWAGQDMETVAATQPDAFARWLGDPAFAPPGGESLAAALVRLRAWLDRRVLAGGKTLAVVPAFTVRALAVAALDLPPPAFWRLDAAPLTLTRLTAGGGRWRLGCFAAPP